MRKFEGLDCILLIDDEEANNFLHRMMIKKAGIDTFVQTTYNGIEALEFLTCTGRYESNEAYPQPGIIFLDINMPLMNGWEFLEEYDKLPEEQKGRIVMAMLTSSLNQDDVDRSKLNIDLKGFISKPLSVAKLNEVIETNFVEIEDV
ncbi:response regulator [Ancylomarina sp. YFZ004]